MKKMWGTFIFTISIIIIYIILASNCKTNNKVRALEGEWKTTVSARRNVYKFHGWNISIQDSYTVQQTFDDYAKLSCTNGDRIKLKMCDIGIYGEEYLRATIERINSNALDDIVKNVPYNNAQRLMFYSFISDGRIAFIETYKKQICENGDETRKRELNIFSATITDGHSTLAMYIDSAQDNIYERYIETVYCIYSQFNVSPGTR